MATVPVKLGPLNEHHLLGMSSNVLVELIWAITKFVYTGDHEQEFVRYSVTWNGSFASEVLQHVRRYYVAEDSTPEEVLKSGHDVEKVMSRSLAHEEAVAPTLVQLITDTALLIVDGDKPGADQLRAENLGSSKHSSLLFVLDIGKDIEGFIFVSDERYQDCAMLLADSLGAVLQAVLGHWDLPLRAMSFLGPGNKKRLFESPEKPSSAYDACLGNILLQQNKDRPNRTAVDAWDGSLTYAELYSLSCQLASRLLENGVELEERVLVCMEKSKWGIVALFGVLLAGATCIPVDIRFPRKRIETLVQISEARFAITDKKTSTLFNGLPLDTLACDIKRDWSGSQLDLHKTPSPSSAAFIYFTSGSTGAPKGVVLQHGTLYATIKEISVAFSLDEEARMYQYSSHTFDISMGDIFGTLISGGCLCIASEQDRLANLSASMNAMGVTHVALTNTVLSQLQPEKIPSLRYLVATGEALEQSQFTKWSSHVDLRVAYGTTESLIYDTFATTEDLKSNFRSIGRSIGSCLWIVDPNDSEKPAPIGSIGEILIEGPLLAKEYLNDHDTTVAKFINGPNWLKAFRNDDSVRCYRSGDLGFRSLDGAVIYLGRADNQVKIRGQRVELNEISRALSCAEPCFEQVAVESVAIEKRGNEKALVAFVVISDDKPANGLICDMDPRKRQLFSNLQSHLAELLPQYMIPSIFIPLKDLPTGNTGKLDRKSLRALVNQISESELAGFYLVDTSSKQAPETPNERLLQNMWADVLHMPQAYVAADGHFFRLGGDSVRAIELTGKLREQGRNLTVAQVFEHPHLSEQARILGQADKNILEGPSPFSLLPEDVSVDSVVQEAARVCNVAHEVIEDIYPVVPMQEALMAISAHREDAYMHRAIFKLPPSLDLERFKAAWSTLASEHPIFRTRIIVLPSTGAIQVVLRSEINWITESSLERYLQADKQEPMVYGTELSRYALVYEHDTVYFVWSGHHAITDGWSKPKMFQEVKDIYEKGSASSQFSYNRFIQHVVQLDMEQADEFWSDQFIDGLETYPRLPSADYVAHAEKEKSVEMSLSRRLGSPITTATLIQAAWALVTGTYAGSDDSLFGVTLSGRDSAVGGIEKIMGITIATVPLRLSIDNTLTVSEFLTYVQEHVNQVKHWQHVGLQHISRLSADAKAASKIENLLVIHPGSEGDGNALSQLQIELLDLQETDTLDISLTVQCTILSGVVRVYARYDENVISTAQLDCVLHTFEHLLTHLSTESDSNSIHSLQRISPYDLELLDSWYGVMPPAAEDTIHGLVEAQAAATPDAIALTGFDGDMTYADLNYRADRLVPALQAVGVGLEARVLLCFHKSSWPVIAMLAVLKSGGVCVSVNPEHPTARIEEIRNEVEASVLLCDESDVARFKPNIPHVLAINAAFLEQISPATSSSGRDPPAVRPTNASFVVFTSGSTGKPKGSVLEHRSLCTSLLEIAKRTGINNQSRTLQFSAYTFDVHILEIFGTLLQGGIVCIISDEERMNHLNEVVHQRKVNLAVLTTTVSRLLDPEKVKTLETLLLTGEPVARRDYECWASRLRLLNGLGPSECTPLTVLTKNPVTESDDPANIGHAIGCRIWITDRRRPNHLAPIGCVGELTVEGPVVGRGYINRPKETEAAFVVDPAWSRTNTKAKATSPSPRRFYRSGDLAKLNVDGSVTFGGRADTQVKIRGQRVELGEIEEHLRHCGSRFSACVVEVLTVSSRGNAQALAAFIANPGSNSQAGPENLLLDMDDQSREAFLEAQTILSSVLPRYMVPSIFFPITHLPFNANGKLERKKLRGLVDGLDVHAMSPYYLAHRNSSVSDTLLKPKEVRLRKIWADILDLPQHSIGVDDSFFRLGGDSVLAMKLIAATRAAGISLTVADVFRVPNLRPMAETMREEVHNVQSDGVVKPFEILGSQAEECIKEAMQECSVDRNCIEDIYPCTATQEALMAVSSYRPKAYTYQAVFKLTAFLDLNRFKLAWEKVATNPIYRTRIIFKRGIGSLQVVLRPQSIDWRIQNLSLEQYLEQEAQIAVAYGSKLCKFAIIPGKSADEHFFVATMHHALYDGWSLAHTFEELRRVYEDKQERPQPLVPYNRFLRYLSTIDQTKSDAFWRSQFPTAVESYPRLPSTDYTPRPRHSKHMRVRNVNRKGTAGVTLANVIQAAWALLMSKYSSSTDVVFGMMLSGRDSAMLGITDVMGPTISTVPMMVDVDSQNGKTVAQFLDSVQKTTAEVTKYQHAGLQCIRRLSAEAEAAAKFQNLLVVHTMSGKDIFSPVRSLGMEPITPNVEEFLDLALTTECTIRSDNCLDILIHYDMNVVDERQADLILHQFEHSILSILEVDKPETALLGDIELSSAYDKNKLLEWNRDPLEKIGISREKHTLHSLVEAQVRKTPDAVATTGFDGEYTYQELNTASRALAAHITGMVPNAGHGKRIVLCFTKSTMPIISMLAILKIGAACVSTNPDHPADRLLEICEDVEAEVVLCDQHLVPRFKEHIPHVIAVSSELLSKLGSASTSWTAPLVSAEDAAFIVYTSGSTGKPKGCVLAHHSVSTSQLVNAKAMRIGPSTRALQYAAYTFDASICEIFAPLVMGGCVCVVSEEERTNIDDMANVMNTRNADWIMLTSTVANLLSPEAVPGLRTLVFGGEALARKVLRKWRQRADIHLVNYWGPSECSNSGCLNDALDENTDTYNIGRASGCSVWITDRSNPDYLMPIGCVGELTVEGSMLGQYYLNRPEATAASFITDPGWTRMQPSFGQPRRFYRSGDMARYNSDGSITFVGRADNQVKIHGQRVELGEIEYQISQYLPEGAEIVVDNVPIEENSRLIAFITLPASSASNDGPDLLAQNLEGFQKLTDDLTQYLTGKLPQYMLPSGYIPLCRIPTNASAKTDRKQLRQLAQNLLSSGGNVFKHGASSDKQQPENELEAKLQLIWSQVLGYSPASHIGTNDSFMSLGGDSITAMQAVSECRKIGVRVSVSTLLRRKTIKAIAPHCTRLKAVSEGLHSSHSKDEVSFSLSPVQKEYIERVPREPRRYNQSFLCRLRGFSSDQVRLAFDLIVARHPMLRARFSHDGDVWQQRTIPSQPGVYRYSSCAVQDPHAHVPAQMEESSSTLDIIDGPVFSVDYFQLANEQETHSALIFMTAHHLVIDLVSWRIIWADLEDILRKSKRPSGENDSISFQSWCEMQNRSCHEEVAKKLQKALPIPVPPSNFQFWQVPEEENIFDRVVQSSFTLNPETTTLLLGSSNQAMATAPLEIFLGTLIKAFSEVFKDREVPSVFVEHHGREPLEEGDEVDATRTVGWFTTTYPLHLPISSGTSVQESIRLAKDLRRKVPGNGRLYYALRHLTKEGAEMFSGHDPAEILVNFAGLFQQLESEDGFLQLEGSISTQDLDHDPSERRWSMIDVEIGVSQGTMEVSFELHRDMAHLHRVQQFVQMYEKLLCEAALELAQEKKQIYTLSDFPSLSLTHPDLVDLLSQKLPALGVKDSDIEDIYPCTAMQEGILLSQQTDQNMYQLPYIWKFRDEQIINKGLPERLHTVWRALVQRHTTLRTGIVESATEEGHFLQVVMKEGFSRFRVAQKEIDDVSELACSTEAMPAENSFWVHLPELTLYRVRGGGAACSLQLSHVLIDGMSLNLLTNELIVSLAEQDTPRLPPVMDFARYVSYEKEHDREKSLSYWNSYLQGVRPCHLPAASERSSQSPAFDSLLLSKDATSNISSFCKRLGITPAVLIQAAWAVVLSVFTGQDDVCFGYLASSRDAPLDHIDTSIGLFISMQICRIKTIKFKLVEQLLSEVRDDVLAGLQHRNCSLAQIQTAATTRNEVSTLFNTCLTVRRSLSNDESIRISDMIDVLEMPEKTEFAVALSALINPTGAEIELTYQSNKISPEQARSIAGSLNSVLRSLQVDEKQPLEALTVIGDADRALLEGWNSHLTNEQYIPATLHGLVEAQVLATPEAIATSGFDGDNTYAELNAKANSLAAYLHTTIGVGIEDRVVLCFNKSTWPIIAMLAVLKSGGVCVSVNPDHPPSRLLDICQDVQASTVLCDAHLADRFSNSIANVVAVNQDMVLEKSPKWKQPAVSPGSAAFIVYTSGSTGKPKGCVLEHHSVAKSQQVNAKAMRVSGKGTRAVQFASYTFDASVCEIFAPLVSGGCVCVISDEERMSDLSGAITARDANWIMLTSTVANLLHPASVPSIRTLVFGGEALSRRVLQKWLPYAHLINYWGPSECSNSGCLNGCLTESTNPFNIGHPSGCSIWITERSNPHQLLPVGCTGEILVEGSMIGRHYVNRPDATSKAFVTNLAWSRNGSSEQRRFYRTGDLAQFNADGTLTFVGRADNQIKIHGQRVELGEIEYHISQYLPQDSEIIVDVVPAEDDQLKVVAFVKLATFKPSADDAASTLSVCSTSLGGFQELIDNIAEYLGGKLPQYMLPSSWIPISRVPTSASAKTERKVLRGYAKSLSRDKQFTQGFKQAKEEPSSEIEFRLRSIWSKVLNYEPEEIGINNTFMSLGGDSITAMQVVSECRKTGIQVPVSVILQKKTIGAIAPSCVVKESTVTHIAAYTDGTIFDLSPIQRQYFKQEGQNWSRYNQSFLCRLQKSYSTDQIRRAFDLIVEKHDMLRARFTFLEGGWKQLITPKGPSSYSFRSHVLDAESHFDAEVPEMILKSSAALDIVNGPVFVIDVFEVRNSQTLVFMAAHHLVIDLVSWRIIWQDLEDIFRYGELRTPQSLPFRQWCEVQQSSSFGCNRVEEVYPLNLPPNNFAFWGVAENENTFNEAMRHTFELSPETTELVLKDSNRALNSTPVEVLTGLLVSSFSQIFADRDTPPVFIEHHGREPCHGFEDLTQTVGWFTTTYPVHFSLKPGASPLEAIRLAKDTLRTVPSNGRPYFANYHLEREPFYAAFAHHYPAEVILNFSGSFQQTESRESLLTFESQYDEQIEQFDRDPRARRWAMINVDIGHSHGSLVVKFQMNRQMAHLSRVINWINVYKKLIERVARQLAQESTTYTLSDFPLLKLNFDDLSDILNNKLPSFGVDPLKDVEDMYPCTSMQEGIILSQQAEESSTMYHLPFIWEFNDNELADGCLARRLQNAWQTLVERHTGLRSGVVATDEGRFIQVVLKKGFVQYEEAARQINKLSDICDLVVPKRDSFWTHLPRLTLYHMRTGKIACCLRLSHVFVDGTSLNLLIRELLRLLRGKTPGLRPLEYSEFVAYESMNFDPDSIQYWKTYLSDVQPCHVPLSTYLPSTNYSTTRISQAATKNLGSLCRQVGVTQSVLLQAAWAIVLGTFTTQDDVCFGYLASTRDASLAGIEDSIGLFLSMQVCRVSLDGTVQDIIHRIRDDVVAAWQHRNCSLASIHNAVGLKSMPLFNTCMNVQRLAQPNQEDTSLDEMIEIFEIPEKTEFAITVNAAINAKDAEIGLTFQDSVSPDVARSITGSFEIVLSSILDMPTNLAQHVKFVNVVGATDRALMERWNEGQDIDVPETIHSLVEAQASKTPDAIATRGFDMELTYKELNLTAEKLAAYLVHLGIAPENRVVLCFTKSTWPIIAILGVLKAGGVCVSLNPEHPSERLLTLTQDVDADVVLCDANLVSQFSGHVKHVVPLDAQSMEQMKQASFRAELPSVSHKNAAIIVYTSGSTGKPKGCILEHHSLATSLIGIGRRSKADSNTRSIQFSAYTFDAHLIDIFTVLIVGGCVCVISDDERMGALPEAINRYAVNWFFLTPSVARLLTPKDVPSLKTLVIGGEQVTKMDVERWGPEVHMVIAYGPTECSLICCMNSSYTIGSDPTNIGRNNGCKLWIVSANRPDLLAPVGNIGEILIEGPVVGRGYLNRPDATDKAFITDPAWSRTVVKSATQNGTLPTQAVQTAERTNGVPTTRPFTSSSAPSRRFYKTGDLAKFNNDGSITIIGRADTQVKYHGQRIELGEIECQIHPRLPSRSDCIVEVIKTGGEEGNQAKLVAFIQMPSSKSTGTGELDLLLRDPEQLHDFQNIVERLTQQLGNTLPQYMVPTAYIPVTFMPKTISGKTDRKQLKEFFIAQMHNFVSGTSTVKQQPRNETERSLQSVWCQVLNLKPTDVGITDMFTSLGGDSISAMKIVGACRKHHGLSISVSLILKLKTIGAIAPHCSKKPHDGSLSGGLKPKGQIGLRNPGLLNLYQSFYKQLKPFGIGAPANIEEVLPLAPFQNLCLHGNLRSPPRHWNYIIFDFPQSTQTSSLQEWCIKLTSHHDVLRTAFVESGYEHVQVRLKDLPPVIDIVEVGQEDIEVLTNRLCWEDLMTQKSLGGTFVRFIIARAAHSVRLVMRLSHAQFDGLSRLNLLKTLNSLYNGQRLPKPVRGFADYIYHIQQDANHALEYWRVLLAGSQLSDPLQLPAISSTSAVKDEGASRVSRRIPPLSSSQGITSATIFNTAVAILLSTLTNSVDVTFARYVSGRAGLDADFQEIVGPCVNIIPIRARVLAGAGSDDLLKSMHKQYLDSIDYETISLDEIIQKCTTWKTSMAEFPVITQHINLEGGFELGADANSPIRARLWTKEAAEAFPRTLSIGALVSKDFVEVAISLGREYAEPGLLERILEELCVILGKIQ